MQFKQVAVDIWRNQDHNPLQDRQTEYLPLAQGICRRRDRIYQKYVPQAAEIPTPVWWYTGSSCVSYQVLRRINGVPVKLPDHQYVARTYEQMQYPGQKYQIDVKFVPAFWLVGEGEG